MFSLFNHVYVTQTVSLGDLCFQIVNTDTDTQKLCPTVFNKTIIHYEPKQYIDIDLFEKKNYHTHTHTQTHTLI